MARWLKVHLPKDAVFAVSPALRARQTADAFGTKYDVVSDLGPSHDVADLLAAVNWPEGLGDTTTVVVVGHQPTLGRLAALLLADADENWTIRKGAVWWFTNRVRGDETQTVLRMALTPDFLDNQ
jgi:phosphohistidine phosphatase